MISVPGEPSRLCSRTVLLRPGVSRSSSPCAACSAFQNGGLELELAVKAADQARAIDDFNWLHRVLIFLMRSAALLLERVGAAEGIHLHAGVVDAHPGGHAARVAVEVSERADQLRHHADV